MQKSPKTSRMQDSYWVNYYRRRSPARESSVQTEDGVSCGTADTPPQYITRGGRTVRVTRRARLQDQHGEVSENKGFNKMRFQLHESGGLDQQGTRVLHHFPCTKKRPRPTVRSRWTASRGCCKVATRKHAHSAPMRLSGGTKYRNILAARRAAWQPCRSC